MPAHFSLNQIPFIPANYLLSIHPSSIIHDGHAYQGSLIRYHDPSTNPSQVNSFWTKESPHEAAARMNLDSDDKRICP